MLVPGLTLTVTSKSYKRDICQALRRDVPDSLNHHQQAWKGLKLVDAEVLAA